jgi:prevent-host-death family protein
VRPETPVSVEEFRRNLAELVSRVHYSDDVVTVMKYRKPSVVMLSLRRYKELVKAQKRKANK